MTPVSNFAHLQQHDEQLVRLGMLVERYVPENPNTCLLTLRQLMELLAQLVASKVGEYSSRDEAQFELLRRLRNQGVLPAAIYQLFVQVRRAGNDANNTLAGNHRKLLAEAAESMSRCEILSQAPLTMRLSPDELSDPAGVGRETKVNSPTSWALGYANLARRVTSPARGAGTLSHAGREMLRRPPDGIPDTERKAGAVT